MEENKIDSIIKDIVDKSSDFYDKEADKAKLLVWEQIQHKQRKHNRPFLLRILAAACVFLLLCTTTVTISMFNTRRTMQEITMENSNLKRDILITKSSSPSIVYLIDTIYKEKKVFVQQTIAHQEIIVDTVYLQQNVYIEKEPVKIFAAENNHQDAKVLNTNIPIYEKEILITNNEPEKQEKTTRIKFKFGRSRNENLPEENDKKSLALTTQL